MLFQHKSAFTHSHTKGRWLLYKEPTCSSGTHTHTFTHQWRSHQEQFGVQYLTQGQRSRGSNHRPSDWYRTRSTYWATATTKLQIVFLRMLKRLMGSNLVKRKAFEVWHLTRLLSSHAWTPHSHTSYTHTHTHTLAPPPSHVLNGSRAREGTFNGVTPFMDGTVSDRNQWRWWEYHHHYLAPLRLMHKAPEVKKHPYPTVSLDKSCQNLLMMLAAEHSVLLSHRTRADFTLILPSTLSQFYITH